MADILDEAAAVLLDESGAGGSDCGLGWLNVVTQFGADPTGANDSAAAFQAALDAVPANGGTVEIPPGKYLVTATLHPTVSGTIIAGSGWGSQILYDGTTVSPLIAMADTTQRRVFIRDLRITQTHASNSGTAINGNYFVDSSLERLLIDGSTAAPNTGISFNATGTYYNVVRDCRISAAGTGGACVYIDSASNSNTVDNCRLIGDSSTTGVHANANGLTIIHPDFEAAGLCGIAVGASGVNVNIINPYLQSLTTAISLASGSGPATILGGDADGSATGISDSGCSALNVIGFRNQAGALQTYFTGGTSTLGLGAAGSAPDAFIWRQAANTPRAANFDITTNARVGGLLIIDSTLSSLGSGASQGIEIQNAATAPSSNPTGGGVLFASGGALKYRGSSGTVTTIAAA